MFNQMLGFDVGMMRFMTAIAAISTLALYLYRIHAIVHCMRRAPGEFPAQVDRVIWCGLSGFMPLGIGAYLYHSLSSKSQLQFLFFFPLAGVILPALYMLLKLWPHTTNFNMNFLGF